MNADDLAWGTVTPRKCRRHRWLDDLTCDLCDAIADQRYNHAMTPSARFWRNVDTTGECWTWKGHRNQNGYGIFSWGPQMPAHRAAWRFERGPIPDGMEVCHSCDNPPCVRPEHLWLGTHAENQADMSKKGRAATGDRNGSRTHPERLPRIGHRSPGEANGQAKLTLAQVLEIRRLRSEGMTYRAIGRRFGIGAPQAYRIVKGHRWSHAA